MKFTFSALIIFLAAGCSTFERDWQAASDGKSTGIEGRWIGRWNSDVNGHNDVLRCLISSKGESTYETRFHAKYSLWFIPVSYGYKLNMTAKPVESNLHFTGEADLGLFAGGVYKYTGEGNTTELHFNYRAEFDRGTFHLQRSEDKK